MAKVVGMEPAEYKVFLPGTRFFGEKDNLEAFGAGVRQQVADGLGAGDPQVPRRQQADRGQAGLREGAGRLAGQGGDQALKRERDDASCVDCTGSSPLAAGPVVDPRADGPAAVLAVRRRSGLVVPLACWWALSNAGLVEKVFMPRPGGRVEAGRACGQRGRAAQRRLHQHLPRHGRLAALGA